MYAREIYRGTLAERVHIVKQQSMDSEKWAEWARKNPRDAELLKDVEIMVAEEEDA